MEYKPEGVTVNKCTLIWSHQRSHRSETDVPISVTHDDERATNGKKKPLQEIILLSGWCREARPEHWHLKSAGRGRPCTIMIGDGKICQRCKCPRYTIHVGGEGGGELSAALIWSLLPKQQNTRLVRCVQYWVGLLCSSLLLFTHDLIKVNSTLSCVMALRTGMTLLKSQGADLPAYVPSDGCRDLMNWGWSFFFFFKQHMFKKSRCGQQVTVESHVYLSVRTELQTSSFKHHF